MKTIVKSFLLFAMAVVTACEPDYPMPYPTSGDTDIPSNNLPKTNILVVHASPNAETTNLLIDNVELADSELDFSEKFPAATFYSNAVTAGARQVRVFTRDISVLSTRANLNGGANSSFFIIGRDSVTLSSRADRLRLIESVAESLPALPTGTPNTTHLRVLNFGLRKTTLANDQAGSGTTVSNIAVQVDDSSPTNVPTNGTVVLDSAYKTFPITTAVSKAYAATSTFTALTLPGIDATNFIVDVINPATGVVILDNVNLSLKAGKVYTLAFIGSDDPSEDAYQLYVITHR